MLHLENKLTCNCTPFLSLLLTFSLIRPFFSSDTLRVIMPSTSMFWRPPSRPHVRVIFSSTRICTLKIWQKLLKDLPKCCKIVDLKLCDFWVIALTMPYNKEKKKRVRPIWLSNLQSRGGNCCLNPHLVRLRKWW